MKARTLTSGFAEEKKVVKFFSEGTLNIEV